MTTYGPDQVKCTVRAYKAGLLSAAGHDLELRLTRFSITIEDGTIEGTFDATSLEIGGAVVEGRVAAGRLTAKDERDILDNLRKTVFKGHRPQQIHFEATDLYIDEDTVEGDGTLTIPPYRHNLSFQARIENGRATCDVVLHQPDWGLVPFKAPLGVLRIKPDLHVRLEVPWPD